MGVFYPVTRFSAQGLKFLDEKYKEGHWGHCEVVAPTLLDMNGYKVVDFGTEYYDSVIPDGPHSSPSNPPIFTRR